MRLSLIRERLCRLHSKKKLDEKGLSDRFPLDSNPELLKEKRGKVGGREKRMKRNKVKRREQPLIDQPRCQSGCEIRDCQSSTLGRQR